VGYVTVLWGVVLKATIGYTISGNQRRTWVIFENVYHFANSILTVDFLLLQNSQLPGVAAGF